MIKKYPIGGLLLIMLSGCAFFSSGADYRYEHYDPATNATTKVVVHSVREVGKAKIHFSPDGEVTVEVEGLSPGPNNLGQALSTIDNLTKFIMTVP